MVMAVDRVSETVALTTRPGYHVTSVYSQLEIGGHRRHKQEVKLKRVLEPVKYADTAFLIVNNTRRRFLSRTYYQPRTQKSFADTTYANPSTTQKSFVSFLDVYSDQLRKKFKTTIEITPKNFKSSVSYPNISSLPSTSGLTNGFSHSNGDLHDVDENMNRRIPVVREKYDPGASQVYIPKRKDFSSPKDILLDSISDQILINCSDSGEKVYSDYGTLNGHDIMTDVSDL